MEVKEIVGAPDGEGWTQVHHFTGLEEEKKEKRGRLVVLLQLGGVSEQTAASLGREIISRVYEEYYGNLDLPVLPQLEKTIEKVVRERPIYLTEKVEISLGLLVHWRRFIYLGASGNISSFLVRNRKVLPLLAGEDNTVQKICGLFQENDLYVLGTTDFFADLPEGMMITTLSAGEIEPALDAFSSLVHSKEKQGKKGLALVKTEAAESEEIPPVASETEPDIEPINPAKGSSPSSPPALPVAENKIPSDKKSFSFSLQRGVSVLLLAILLGSAIWGWQRQKKIALDRETERLFEEASQKFAAAKAVLPLDSQHSVSIAKQAVLLVEKAGELRSGYQEASKLKEEINNFLATLDQEKKYQPQSFFQLSLLAEGSRGSQILWQDGKIWVLDLVTKRLFSISYPEKKTQTFLAGETFTGAQMLTIGGPDKFYLLTKEGIVRWDGKESKETVLRFSWQKPVAFASWSGNLYVLDSEARKLWKMNSLSKGFSLPVDWLSVPPQLAWDKVKDMAINGHIWILDSEGRISRFYAGKEKPLSFEKEQNTAETDFLAVATDASVVVTLDVQKRLGVWDKDGKQLAKISLEAGEIVDLTIDNKGENVFLLSPTEVLRVDMAALKEAKK